MTVDYHKLSSEGFQLQLLFKNMEYLVEKVNTSVPNFYVIQTGLTTLPTHTTYQKAENLTKTLPMRAYHPLTLMVGSRTLII